MVWDVEAWRQVAYYPLPYGVTSLRFSPKGDFLITASVTGKSYAGIDLPEDAVI